MNKINEWYRAEAKLDAQERGRNHYEVGADGTVCPPNWYMVGNPDYKDREALMLVIEAARAICGMASPKIIEKLLTRAIQKGKQ